MWNDSNETNNTNYVTSFTQRTISKQKNMGHSPTAHVLSPFSACLMNVVSMYLSLINTQTIIITINKWIERREQKKKKETNNNITNCYWKCRMNNNQWRWAREQSEKLIDTDKIMYYSYVCKYFYYLPYELKTYEVRIQNDWSQVYVLLELKFSSHISNKMKLISIEWNVHER